MSMFRVQSPEKDIFSAADLDWKYDIAYIPTNRLHQFLAGEELGGGTAPTKFKIMSSRTRKEGTLQVHRIRPECWLKYTRYWCTYGPKDHRSQDKLLESTDGGIESIGRTIDNNNRRQSSTRGEDFARGCTCHFNVKVMYLWPNITQINYVHKTHTNAAGSICHGSLDPSAVGSKAQFAPRLSMDMRRWVLYLLSRNIPPKQILTEHQLLIQGKRSKSRAYVPVRDDFLNKHDILNISKRLAEDNFRMHMLEDESVRIWTKTHSEYVVYHQQEDNSTNSPFILVLQTVWQKDKLVTLGHQRVVACSATLGTKRFKYQMFSLLVFDMHRNAIPGAWVITSSTNPRDTQTWLARLNQNMNEHLSGWRPSCFIVDSCGSEVEAIRTVFDAPVYLCLWRVRRSWLRHLNRKVSNINTRVLMFRKLGEIMYLSSEQSLSLCNTETHALKQVDSFLEDFKGENSFGSFFRETWLPKIGVWIKATQNIPHTNVDINSAIEGYHANLKARLHQGRETLPGRRVDWLLHTLAKDVESHFWFIDFSKRWDFWHNTTQELVIESALSQAAKIPDCNVSPGFSSHELAVRGGHGTITSTVVDDKDSNLVYTVYNSDTEWSCCDCDWAQQGHMCKHQLFQLCTLVQASPNRVACPRRSRLKRPWYHHLQCCNFNELFEMFLQLKILVMKGATGHTAPTQDHTADNGNQIQTSDVQGKEHTSATDHDSWGRAVSHGRESERMAAGSAAPSRMSSTTTELESHIAIELDDDEFEENHMIIERLESEDDHSKPVTFANFERSFLTLIDSISNIDNVTLANYVTNIMNSAAHKISRLEEVASESQRDMAAFQQDPGREFGESEYNIMVQNHRTINDLKRSRSINSFVQQSDQMISCRKRKVGTTLGDMEIMQTTAMGSDCSYLGPFLT